MGAKEEGDNGGGAVVVHAVACGGDVEVRVQGLGGLITDGCRGGGGGWTGDSDAASAARSGWGRRDGASEDDMDERVDGALEDDEDIGARD
jgi:hypothetical protein